MDHLPDAETPAGPRPAYDLAEDELAWRWSLTPANLAVAAECRGDDHCRCFAVQLCWLRAYGRFLDYVNQRERVVHQQSRCRKRPGFLNKLLIGLLNFSPLALSRHAIERAAVNAANTSRFKQVVSSRKAFACTEVVDEPRFKAD